METTISDYDFSEKGKRWFYFYHIYLLNIVVFFMITVLSQPLWYEINNSINSVLGIISNWVLLIVIMSGANTAIVIYLLVKHYQSRALIQPLAFNRAQKITPVPLMILYNILLSIYLSQLGNEAGIIYYNFREIFPWMIFFGLLIVFSVAQTRLSLSWEAPRSENVRKLLTTLVLMLLLSFSVSYISPKPVVIIYEIDAGPYLVNPADDGITIMWITSRDSVSWVEYGTDENLTSIVKPSVNGLFPVGKIHKVRLQNLEAGVTYYYRVVSQEVRSIGPGGANLGNNVTSLIHNFSTLNSSTTDFTFLFFSDIQEQENIYQDVLDTYTNGSYDFVVLNGNMLNFIDTRAQIIEQLLQPVTEAFANQKGFFYTMGSLERRGELARDFGSYLDFPDDRNYYSFNHGPVHFTVLDTGEEHRDESTEYSGLVDYETYRAEQTEWLKQEIASDDYTNAEYRIVLTNIPLNQYILTKNDNEFISYQHEWASLLNGTADLMLSGHLKTHEIFEPGSENNPYNFPIILGGGYFYEDQSLFKVNINLDRIEINATAIAEPIFGENMIYYEVFNS